MWDVAIIGAGMAGMATATRLQAAGLSTIVLEAHGRPGGCAGYFRQRGFSVDVGATTLVDFEPGGVGGEWLDSIGFRTEGEALPGYVAWLPDRTVTLHRDHTVWAAERLATLGDTPAFRAFWSLLDRLAAAFWQASRNGVRLPIRTPADALRNLRAVDPADWPLLRYVRWTMGDALRACGLREFAPLVSLLGMLIEDTVHSTVDDAPLINAALGVTIRGAGLTRHQGGMWGFWRRLVAHYRAQSGDLRLACPVERIEGQRGNFTVHARRGVFPARQVVCALPAGLVTQIAPALVGRFLRPYVERDEAAQGGAVVVFLGVPEDEVTGQSFTHHQLLQDYAAPLGNGNNMFVSVSAPGDTESAPPGCRAVMISTHCELAPWENLSPEEYQQRKAEIGAKLLGYARRVYPRLGERACVYEIGTPRTYERFTGRPRGAVGGVRQTLYNANQRAIPYEVGLPGFWLAGDTTWPGLGTVACVLGSRHVAEGVRAFARPIRTVSVRQTIRAQNLAPLPETRD